MLTGGRTATRRQSLSVGSSTAYFPATAAAAPSLFLHDRFFFKWVHSSILFLLSRSIEHVCEYSLLLIFGNIHSRKSNLHAGEEGEKKRRDGERG